MIILNPNGVTLASRGMGDTNQANIAAQITGQTQQPADQWGQAIGGIIQGLFGTTTAVVGSIAQAKLLDAQYKERRRLLEDQKREWQAERDYIAAGGGQSSMSPVIIILGIGTVLAVIYYLTR